MTDNTPIESPCIGYCCLDEDNVCLGCFRSLSEIKEWSSADPQELKNILNNAERRKEIKM